MKALTLWQPWATAIALGLKQYETRAWFASYRGDLAIHAAKKPITKEISLFFQEHYPDWENLLNLANQQKGCIVAICNLIDCIEMDDSLITQQTKLELMFGNWQIGRYAWKLDFGSNAKKLGEPKTDADYGWGDEGNIFLGAMLKE